MFCRKCGTQADAGAKFCGSCGEIVAQQPPDQTTQITASLPQENGQPSKKSNHKKIGMIACAVVLLVVIIGVVAIFSQSGNDLDSRLIGTWEWADAWSDGQIEFRRNGTGVEVWWEEEVGFTWRTDQDGRLWRQYDEEFDEWWVYYEVDENLLRMTTEWYDIWEYRKVR